MLELISTVKEQYDLKFDVEVGYTDKDCQEAVAFLLRFPYGSEPFGNFHDREEFEIDFYPCEFCLGQDSPEVIYLSINSNISKKFKTSCMGIADSYQDNFISKPLYDELISKGIDSEIFRPIHNYYGKAVGYRFYGEKYILSPGVLTFPGDFEYSKCTICGREYIDMIFYEYSMESILKEFSEELKGFLISKKGLEELNSVGIGLTTEYFQRKRELVINKQIYELMKEKWTDISKYVIPIFLEK